jgi:methionine-S-sulfoxide reductase
MFMVEKRAVLAGGCFWGVQDLIRRYEGVLSTRVGYTGASVPPATYRNHGSHAEAVEITFDPARVSYRQTLEFFFQIYDPSTRNRQGNDVGTSYRSAILYTSDEQSLSPTKSRRLHLPFRPAPLETADSHRQGCRAGTPASGWWRGTERLLTLEEGMAAAPERFEMRTSRRRRGSAICSIQLKGGLMESLKVDQSLVRLRL